MKFRHFLLLIVVLMSSWTVGCSPKRGNMDYLASGGQGEVRGEMSGVEFCALVEIGKGGEFVRVEYCSPDSLSGLILRAEGDRCEVSLGEMSFACDVSDVAGFLRPATAFLIEEEATTVQKEGENTVLQFPTGGKLVLSSKGEPIALSREDIQLQMVWWQSEKVASDAS